MSVDAIATVIADLRAGRVHTQLDAVTAKYTVDLAQLSTTPEIPTIDVTSIFRGFMDSVRSADLYCDHELRPPLDMANVAYINSYGNVTVFTALWTPVDELDEDQRWQPVGDVEHSIDWSDMKWVCRALVWLGGSGGDGPFPTSGPFVKYSMAVKADGTIQDIHWMQYDERLDMGHWDNALVTFLRSITFLNCRNVVIVEPRRPRAERRRLERVGVTVSELHITQIGKWARTQGAKPPPGSGTPLTTVRGHLARYGIEGRKLLFGKYAGTFWIRAHARGSHEHGESLHDYTIDKEPNDTVR